MDHLTAKPEEVHSTKNLWIFPAIVLGAMIAVTTWASVEKPISQGFRDLFAERWGIATLLDAYFAFLTFYAWVHYKERSNVARFVWLVSILGFGNIAMAIYMLKELRALPKGASVEDFLLKRKQLA